MIKAQDFLNLLKEQGYNFFTGVACSYLTELINLISADNEITYIAATNEGDAVGIAAGAYLAGNKPVVFMQNSGLGNAVNPITSLLHPFEMPILFLITHRGDPQKAQDEPQHRLMGSIMLDLLDQMKVKHVDLEPDTSDLKALVLRVTSAVKSEQQSYAFVIKKGCFDNKGASDTSSADATRHRRRDVLAFIQQHFKEQDAIVLATTGYTGRELYALEDRSNQFYMVGSMGCVSSMGLGMALEQPHKKVVVIDGDGAAMMRMGAMATIGYYQPDNLLHVLLDNGVYESTGAQDTVAGGVDFSMVARGCGYRETFDDDYQSAVRDWQSGLRFVYVKTQAIKGKVNYPRPTVTPAQVAIRLKRLLQESVNEVA